MKKLFIALAFVALPAVAHAAEPAHAEHMNPCCKQKDADGTPKDCCEKAKAEGGKNACCEKHEMGKDAHAGHDMSKH